MDASNFRWVLIVIAVLLALGIYLFGLHQAGLRKRDAIETFNHDEVDSAFGEDEQLRHEMDSLNTVSEEGEIEGSLDEIHIHPTTEARSPSLALDRLDEMRIDPATEDQLTPSAEDNLFEGEIDSAAENESPLAKDQDEDKPGPVARVEPEFTEANSDEDQMDSAAQVEPEFTEKSLGEDELDAVAQAEPKPVKGLEEDQIDPPEKVKKKVSTSPDPEIFLSPELADMSEDRLVCYHLRHEDFRLIVGEEAESAVQNAGLELSPDGLLEYYEEDELVFQIASLSAPGSFFGIEDLEFVTLGFNCFIDLDACTDPRTAYEAMLRKIDELVRVLDVMVYKPDSELLSISDITDIRDKLA